MTVSKANTELHIKVGVLEKLVDNLTDKLELFQERLLKIEMLRESGLVQPIQAESDEWAIDNATGKVEKTAAGDEVDFLMGNQ